MRTDPSIADMAFQCAFDDAPLAYTVADRRVHPGPGRESLNVLTISMEPVDFPSSGPGPNRRQQLMPQHPHYQHRFLSRSRSGNMHPRPLGAAERLIDVTPDRTRRGARGGIGLCAGALGED
jgi:hypothetical protein